MVNPILVDKAGNVIAGEGRILASQLLGLTELPVIVLDHLTQAQARALRIADNKIAANSGWDEEKLCAELAALLEEEIDLSSLGFSELELKRVLDELDHQTGHMDDDAVPDPPQQPVTITGDYHREEQEGGEADHWRGSGRSKQSILCFRWTGRSGFGT